MAEKLSDFLIEAGMKTTYIHSDIDTIERVEIMRNLRLGNIEILIGVNLLREGLDLPEVSLVAILDADKEGFLRSTRSLIQTIGRAARHINGTSILYADEITNSIRETINETNRKRDIQILYNQEHNITPQPLKKNVRHSISLGKELQKNQLHHLNTEDLNTFSIKDLKQKIKATKKLMNSAAIAMNFIEAATHRDNLFTLEKKIKELT